ncbi:MAG: arginine--tRNA ligase [Armatimonadota bacterium]|nr:arginine--tRNA ligase [Armatimonadota bacterium]MDR7453533.1 arginine--tRNA ligase [Armatimonadota bacterium]MDR7455672.1 arginine--tRNA ligase [Armatimonadota bacterium]MDR7497393.1 arginine--tRNA ligase [Armatimonadota bacterium]MDR7511701.1 arginine--tRNA ligase [Armatimonadota bacterium]
MFRDALREEIRAAIGRAAVAGRLPPVAVPAFEVEVPRDRRHGDYATNAALVLAKAAGASPRQVADALVEAWAPAADRVAALEVAGPGFINIRLAWPWRRALVAAIRAEGDGYGASTVGAGRRVNVEFVSANPTGPLHVGTGRNAVIGDVLANLLAALGYQVTREYYINDAGQQVHNLARSVEAHYFTHFGRPRPVPEDGYHGDYVADLARRIAEADGPRWLEAPEAARLDHFREVSVAAVIEEARADLARFRVVFDVWFSERSLVRSGAVDRALADLRARDYVYEADGKTWFRSTAFGDDKDRVIVKPTGEWTYFGSDIAYHLDKRARGFDLMIDVWAIDHIGDVARVRGGLQALGVPPEALEILIYQHVRLKNEGEALRMSKRRGEFVTLRELIDAVGVDAGRYFYAMVAPGTPMDFDVALARAHSQDNPVYYVQYAHARIAGILREAAAAGAAAGSAPPLDRLEDEREWALLHTLAELPEVIRAAGLRREPHRLCAYAREVAEAFHLFYTHCRVLGDDPGLTAARLAVVEAARTVLRRVLGLLGVCAPERM